MDRLWPWLLDVLSTVRVKIIGGVAVILILVITGMTFILIDLTRNDLFGQLRLRGDWALDTLFRELDRQGLDALGPGVTEPGTPGVDEVLLLDRQRMRLGAAARTPYLGTDLPVLARVLATGQGSEQISGQHLLLYAPYTRGGQTLAAARVSLPLEPLRQAIAYHRRNVFQVIAIESGLILLLISLLLTMLVAKPIEQLVRAAERIAQGHLSYRVDVLQHGEIGRLAQAFNRMLERLEEARSAKERHIEDLEAAYAALKRTQAQLVVSEKLASVGRLAAGVAHEIGNPLSSIHGYTEILLMEETSTERRQYIERVQLETERITRIIQSLLDYSRPGKSPDLERPANEIVDLGQVVHKTLYLVKPQPGFATIRLRSSGPERGPAVLADEHQLTQVLIDLLLNAQQAVGPGGEVEVLTGKTQEQWPPAEGPWPELPARFGGASAAYLAVRDNGPGVPGQNLDKLFEPFFTTKPPGSGTGLGLFVVHNILESLGGEVRVASEVGHGACFVVFLPEAKR